MDKKIIEYTNEFISLYKEAKILEFLRNNYNVKIVCKTEDEIVTKVNENEFDSIIMNVDVRFETEKNIILSNSLGNNIFFGFNFNEIDIKETEPEIVIKDLNMEIKYDVYVNKIENAKIYLFIITPE